VAEKSKEPRSVRCRLKRGGKLLFAENLVATRIHQYLRSKIRRWSWRYVAAEEMTGSFTGVSAVEFHSAAVVAPFGANETQRTILSYVDRIVLSRMCPDSWSMFCMG
jgi:hypothetical protein